MNRPPEMDRIDFVQSRLNSISMDISAIHAKSHGSPEEDILTAIHDAIRELNEEVRDLRAEFSPKAAPVRTWR